MSKLSSYIELKKELGADERELELYERNNLLLEIANGFHEELVEYGELLESRGFHKPNGSLLGEVEVLLVRVLNGYAYEDVVSWMGYGVGYGLRWEE